VLSFIIKAWPFFRGLFIVLLVAFSLGGLNDLFVDVYYWLRLLFRRLFKRALIKPLTLERVSSVPEKPIAVMLPAWHEAGVIASMLLNTINTLNYRNYFIFVGTYPNDPETQAEVDKVREVYPQVVKVVNARNGPTTKADNLNEIYKGIRLFEEEQSFRFDIIVLSDSEDIHHPLSLKLFNYLMPRFEMIQVPIIPLEVPWNSLVGGVYMDEFAEMHLKELIVREKIARVLPSAGTSTAFWREGLRELELNSSGRIFNPASLAEDYEVGIRLGKLGLKQIILVQYIERVMMKKPWFGVRPRPKKVRELVATRAFFLTKFRKAMRQRARWVYGIAWQGLRNIGWTRELKVNYTLLRDRLAFLANIFYFLGYVLLGYIATIFIVGLFRPDFHVPPLIRHDELWWKLALLVLFFLFWRLFMRFVFVFKLYGFTAALMTPVRIVVGNILNFASSGLAFLWLIRAVSTGREQGWVKTEHEFPSAGVELFRRKIGDLLLARRRITAGQLEEAVRAQEGTGKKLGEILVEKGYVTEEELMSALAEQARMAYVEIDPFAVEPEILALVPRRMAERYRFFPLKKEGDTLRVAVDRIELGLLPTGLADLLEMKVGFSLTTKYDLDFAIKKAYSEEYRRVVLGRRLGELLLRDGRITAAALEEALRRQKRSDESLGAILLAAGAVPPAVLERYLAVQAGETERPAREADEAGGRA
jgi:adsorption protein B